MLRTVPLRLNNSPLSSCSALLLESSDLHCSKSSPTKPVSSNFATISCSSARSNAYIPKLEPFSRTKFDRVVKDPPLIQKAENELADYCSTLEGDTGYSCWKAYFELKDLEKENPKEEVERLILQAGGVKSLIGCVHGITAMHKDKKEEEAKQKAKALSCKNSASRPCPVPDGLPKSREEIEDEENAKMPDSPFTRLLRTKGRYPAWYSPAPDHE